MQTEIYIHQQPATWPIGINDGAFNNDGTRLFWIQSTNDKMYWADLSVPYDIKSMIVPSKLTYTTELFKHMKDL